MIHHISPLDGIVRVGLEGGKEALDSFKATNVIL
jgi:hypothetical protein